jgi:hypothetical protein
MTSKADPPRAKSRRPSPGLALAPSVKAVNVKAKAVNNTKPMSQPFRDKLKSPGWLSQFDVARIRAILEKASEAEFAEYMGGCSTQSACKILRVWEMAQLGTWTPETLEFFFSPLVYSDRELVSARLSAAVHVGALPEKFPPLTGLEWLEAQRIPMGSLPQWVRANVGVQGLLVPHVALTPSIAPQPHGTLKKLSRDSRRTR